MGNFSTDDVFRTDLVDDFKAAISSTDNYSGYNALLSSSFYAAFTNTETITATKELTDTDYPIQVLTAGTTDQVCELPVEAVTNHPHLIICASTSSNNIIVKDDAGAVTYVTLEPGERALCISSGTAWTTSILDNGSVFDELVLRRDWFLSWSDHFNSDPSWTWWNDPTGTNGVKVFGNSHFTLQADDTLAKAFYYQTGTTTSRDIHTMLYVSFQAEGGLRVDDGTDNNYVELYLEYESAGKMRVVSRRRSGGGSPVETNQITGLSFQKYYLRMVNSSTNMLLYFGNDYVTGYSQVYMGAESLPFTASSSDRYGIFATKAGAGSSRAAIFDAWKE